MKLLKYILIFLLIASPALATMQNAEKQLLADGDMEKSGVTDWSVRGTAVLTKQSGQVYDGSQVLRVSGIINDAAVQTITTVGKIYRITGWARSDGTTVPTIIGGTVYWTGIASTNWQYFDVVVTADSSNLNLWISTAAGYIEFDNVLVTEYTPPTKNAEKQLLTDGDMEMTTTEAWTVVNNATLSKETASPYLGSNNLKILRNGTNYPVARQESILTIGKRYRISGVCKGDGAIVPRITDGVTAIVDGTISTTWQKFDTVFTATGERIDLGFTSGGTGTEYVEYDNVLVTEYTPPVKNEYKQLLLDGDMEKAGTSDWTATRATLTKETGSAEDGSRILRVTATAGTPVSQQAILTVGKTYRVTGWARSDGNIPPRIGDGADGDRFWLGTTSTSWQHFDGTGVAGHADITLNGLGGVATNYIEFDDVFVTEVNE